MTTTITTTTHQCEHGVEESSFEMNALSKCQLTGSIDCLLGRSYRRLGGERRKEGGERRKVVEEEEEEEERAGGRV